MGEKSEIRTGEYNNAKQVVSFPHLSSQGKRSRKKDKENKACTETYIKIKALITYVVEKYSMLQKERKIMTYMCHTDSTAQKHQKVLK